MAHAPTPTADNPSEMDPAGQVHMARCESPTYLMARASRHPMLSPASWNLLHTPVTHADARYTTGWVAPRAAARVHSGSNTIWFATGGFNTRGDAMAIVTNIGGGADLPGPVERPVLDWLSDV